MESVLQKFKAMKEENLKFITDTTSKANSCFSVTKAKNCNIDLIATKIKQISVMINQCDFFNVNYKKNLFNFFDFFYDEFTKMMNDCDLICDEKIVDVKTILSQLSQNIDDLISDDKDERGNAIQSSKIYFDILETILKKNCDLSKETLSKVKFYINKIKNLILYNNNTNNDVDLFIPNIIEKIIIAKHMKKISKIINKFYNEKIYSIFSSFRNYDIKVYIPCSDADKEIKRCLKYITSNIMKKYVIIVNNSKYKDYMYINIFGTGKSQRLLIKYIEKMLKIVIESSICVIKIKIYENINEMLHIKFKRISKTKDEKYFNYNFDDLFISKYLTILKQ